MTTIAVTWGYEGEHALATWGAHHVLDQPAQLIALLSKLLIEQQIAPQTTCA